jgi:glycosyltransferase involved in cell wall biosynthesis
MPENAHYAIITPYYKEERRVLERCIDSVRKQSFRADHFLVADGFPQDWIDTAGVRHLKLDRNHADNGNTPRGVGALLAVAEGYSAIGLLDADNWFSPDHVEACLGAASKAPSYCDYVIARRTFRRLDESIMPIGEEPNHVDTSCLLFLRGAFSVLPHWAMMPRRLSPACDRVIYSVLVERRLVAARVEKPTVHFQTLYENHYRMLGETPPPGATPSVPVRAMNEWLDSLPRRESEITRRLMGLASPEAAGKPQRNDKCPCGSGRKYKQCHGAA